MKPVYCINKNINTCHECIHRRGNKDCGGVTLDIKEHNQKMTISDRLDRMRILTTEPPKRYYEYYKKDDKGRPIVNTLNISCIPIRRDKTIGWNNNCKSELKKLTDEWLKDLDPYNSLDLKEKVKRYQAGELDYYESIRSEVIASAEFVLKSAYKCRNVNCGYYEAGIKTAIFKECPKCHTKNKNEPHFQEVKKGLFVTLDGASAQSPKRKQSIIPQPGDDDFDFDEAAHNNQIDLTLEGDIFNENEKQAIIDVALEAALKSYSKDQGTFKSWFKLKFTSAALDAYRQQQDYQKGKRKKINAEILDQKKKDLTKIWDYSILTDSSIPKDIYNNASDEEKRLMIIRTIAGAEKIPYKQEYDLLGIGKDKHKKLQDRLNKIYDDWKGEPQETGVKAYQVEAEEYRRFIEGYYILLSNGLLYDDPVYPVWPAHYPWQLTANIPSENIVNDMTFKQVLSGQADGYIDLKITSKKYNYIFNYIMRIGENGEIIKYTADGMPCRRCRRIFDRSDLIKHWNLTTVTGARLSMFAVMQHSDDALKEYSKKNNLLDRTVHGRVMVKNIMYICAKCNKKEKTALFTDKYMKGKKENGKGETYEQIQVQSKRL